MSGGHASLSHIIGRLPACSWICPGLGDSAHWCKALKKNRSSPQSTDGTACVPSSTAGKRGWLCLAHIAASMALHARALGATAILCCISSAGRSCSRSIGIGGVVASLRTKSEVKVLQQRQTQADEVLASSHPVCTCNAQRDSRVRQTPSLPCQARVCDPLGCSTAAAVTPYTRKLG